MTTSPIPPSSQLDEGGLRPPPGLSFARRIWWWFDFLILVKLARLRFAAILVAIGLVITQWDTLVAWYERWRRPAGEATASGFEYFCPMHPAIVRDNPKDKCPICFMPLSKRKTGDVAQAAPLPAGIVSRVQLSPYRVVLAGVGTWEVGYVPLEKEIVAAGLIEFNERGQKTVAARVAGRIDELLVSETGQSVEKNQVLASVYSPDLLVTVQSLLQAQQAKNTEQVRDSRTRLELLGIDGPQIDEILQTAKANTHLKIRSPLAGHVIQKYVREGQYVEAGMPLYDVADLTTVWIAAQIYEEDISLLPNNGERLPVVSTTRAFPGEEFRGTLSFIYPHVDLSSRTLTVRFEIDNPEHKLRPGSTATVRLSVAPQHVAALRTAKFEEGKVLAVPALAVIETGEQQIVYRQAEPGVFEGALVKLGPKLVNSAGVAFYPVLSGLAAGERIVTAGSFLVDAETRLNPAAGSIYFGGTSGAKTAAASTVRPTTPEDPEAKIAAGIAKLPPADRQLAEQQRFCTQIAGSRLGSMGVPVKLSVGGETVFVCCDGCKGGALAKPQAAAAKAKQLRAANSSREPAP